MRIYEPITVQSVQTIDQPTYESYRDDLASFELWRNGRTSYHTSEVPNYLPHVDNRNRMRGLVEQYEFRHNPPNKYFCYWSKRVVSQDGQSYQLFLTTWAGDILAKVSGHNEYRDNFGGTRVSFQALAINGLWYHGTYYKSAGDYCRIKRMKNPPC